MRPNPQQIIYELTPRECPECKETQWLFFKSPEEFHEWKHRCDEPLIEKTPSE